MKYRLYVTPDYYKDKYILGIRIIKELARRDPIAVDHSCWRWSSGPWVIVPFHGCMDPEQNRWPVAYRSDSNFLRRPLVHRHAVCIELALGSCVLCRPIS